jgi:transcriptional regulator with XRE-family HTH domain
MSNEIAKPASKPNRLGDYLNSVRRGLDLSLREVEEKTKKDVSNAYLSQLENGKIEKPSPHILHSLSIALNISYEDLMERAGYIKPATERAAGAKHGNAATFAIDNLTVEEEAELLKHLAFLRWQRSQ